MNGSAPPPAAEAAEVVIFGAGGGGAALSARIAAGSRVLAGAEARAAGAEARAAGGGVTLPVTAGAGRAPGCGVATEGNAGATVPLALFGLAGFLP